MENNNNYTYSSSYPDSGDSSPPSETNEDAPATEAPPLGLHTTGNCKVKLMISYGGRIQPRAHDNQLSYLNGETKILSIERGMRYADLRSKMAVVSGFEDVCVKYQLPGEDLDSLVSVTNDEDLDHLVLEFDRLSLNRNGGGGLSSLRGGTPRIRVFLFPVSRPKTEEQHWFVEALNFVPTVPVSSTKSNNGQMSPDYLFGLESGFVPPPAVKVKDPVPELVREQPVPVNEVKEERQIPADLSPVVSPSPVEIQKQIQELERIQINDNNNNNNHAQNPTTMVRNGSDETLARSTYLTKPQEIIKPPTPPNSVQQVQSPPASAVPQPTVTAPAGYFPSMTGDHRPVYLIPPGYFTAGGASFVYAMPPPGQGGAPAAGAPAMPAGYDGAGRAVYYTSMVPSGYHVNHQQVVTSNSEANSNP